MDLLTRKVFSRSGRPVWVLVVVLSLVLLLIPIRAAAPAKGVAAINPAFATLGTEAAKAAAGTGVSEPVCRGDATTWYLAEGYTGGEFDTWVVVQNPGKKDTAVKMEFQLPPGASAEPYQFDLPAGTRRSVHLDALPGLEATDVSTRVTSDEPVMVERSVYFNYNGKTGGHDSVGVKYPCTLWYLAEGYTGGNFDTYVLVQNTGAETAGVRLEFQLPPGSGAAPYEFELPSGSRKTVHLDELPGLADTDVSTRVVSTGPVVAERAMYFDYYGRQGGSDAAGVDHVSDKWFLAEGYTGGEFDTYVLVQNPGQNDAKVTLGFQLPPGATAPAHTFDLPAGTRRSIHLDELAGLEATDVSTMVTADKPVVAERAMYFNYNGKTDGHVSTGAYFPSQFWFIPEGYTGGDFDTYVLVQNPGKETKKVTLEFQLPPGSSAPDYSFDLPGGARQSVHLDELPGLSNTDVSTLVSSKSLVVAESSMYFNYEGRDGGSCSIGALYEPPVIPSTTKTLSAKDIDHLVEFSPSGDNLAITFDQDTPALKKLATGDVVICGITDKTPYGMMQKVKKVKRDGGRVVLITATASLEEAIWRARLSSSNLQETAKAGSGGAQSGTGVPEMDFGLPTKADWNATTGCKAKVTDSLTVTPDFDLQLEFEPPTFDVIGGDSPWNPESHYIMTKPPKVHMKHFHFNVDLNKTYGVSLQSAGGKIVWEGKELKMEGRVVYPVGVPPIVVPIIINPCGSMKPSITGSHEGETGFEASVSAGLKVGCSYDGGFWTTTFNPYFDKSCTKPKGIKKGEISAELTMRGELKFYGVCGPYIEVAPYIKMDYNGVKDDLWALSVGVRSTFGVKAALEIDTKDIPVIGEMLGKVGIKDWKWSIELFNESFPMFSPYWVLCHQIKVYDVRPDRVKQGERVLIQGTGFGNETEYSGGQPEDYITIVDLNGLKWHIMKSQCEYWSDSYIQFTVPLIYLGFGGQRRINCGPEHLTVTRHFLKGLVPIESNEGEFKIIVE